MRVPPPSAGRQCPPAPACTLSRVKALGGGVWPLRPRMPSGRRAHGRTLLLPRCCRSSQQQFQLGVAHLYRQHRIALVVGPPQQPPQLPLVQGPAERGADGRRLLPHLLLRRRLLQQAEGGHVP